MALKLYNTFGRELQEFKPIKSGKVGLYTCGPTVYDFAHLGNLRTYIFEDVLRRTLMLNGYMVKHVMNVTDVGHLTDDADHGEDKVEKAAQEQKRDAKAITAEYQQAFFEDLKNLNVLKPHVIVRAASDEAIKWQIDLIKKLEKKGFTYTTSDGIYFHTSKFPRYGQLSGQKAEEKKSGARVEMGEKKHPTDFALWKFSQSGTKRQMEWNSPWGVGFPGWHIECSAISMHELGEQFDIHTGGIDHIAVHHENEIAQSEAATGKHPFVNYWMHGEFLVLPGKRMGKSEGNKITLGEITKKVPALAYRYLVLQSHYRTPLTFTLASLEGATQGLNRIWATVDNAASESLADAEIISEFASRFQEALNLDLNTAQALAVMHEVLSSEHTWNAKRKTLEYIDQVLGLDLLGKRETAWITPNPQQQQLLNLRERARQAKDWAAADHVRDELAQKGLEIIDTDQGPRLRKK